MARYIDADKVMEKISHITVTVMGDRSYGKTIFGKALNSYREEVLKRIEDAPTANVVPKSEVEKIFEEIETELDTFDGSWANTVTMTQYLVAELKKKYTEDK